MKISIPPQTLGLYRDIYITVTLYAIHSCSNHVKSISIRYDLSKNLEYLDIEADNEKDFENCVIQYYSIKLRPNEKLEDLFYTNWVFAFDANSGVWRLWMGGNKFIMHDVHEYAKFFYAKDLATLTKRDERVSKGKPKPLSGYLDICFDDYGSKSSRVTWYLGKLSPCKFEAPGVGSVLFYVTATHITPSVADVRVYVNVMERFIEVRQTKAGYALYVSPPCKSFLSTNLAVQEPDILSKWFELTILEHVLTGGIAEAGLAHLPPIRVYGISGKDLKKGLIFSEIPISSVPALKHVLQRSAESIGKNVLSLVRNLRKAIECLARISSYSDERVARVADALRTYMRLVLNEVFSGEPNPETLYKLVRYTQLAYDTFPNIDAIRDLLKTVSNLV